MFLRAPEASNAAASKVGVVSSKGGQHGGAMLR
jgi:hypothetical protein